MAFFSGYFKIKGTTGFSTELPTRELQTLNRLSKCRSTWLVQSLGKPPWPCHTRDKVYFKLSLPLCRHPNQPFLGQSCWFHQTSLTVGLWRENSWREGEHPPHTAQHLSSLDPLICSMPDRKKTCQKHTKAPFSAWIHCWKDQAETWSFVNINQEIFSSVNELQWTLHVCLLGCYNAHCLPRSCWEHFEKANNCITTAN